MGLALLRSEYRLVNPIISTNEGYFDTSFVASLNPSGSAFRYLTYLPAAVTGIAVESGGNAWLAGTTDSDRYPTVNPVQPLISPGADFYQPDAFVAKISGDSRPQLSAAPRALQFRAVTIGESSQNQFWIFNVGSVPLQLTGITVHGDFFRSTSYAECGTSVPAAGKCVVAVQFKPTGPAGPKTGSVTITHNSQGGPAVVALAGIAHGQPGVSARIVSKSKTGTLLTLGVEFRNSGWADARNVSLTGVSLRTLGGSGTAAYSGPPLSAAIGNLAIAAVANRQLRIDVPAGLTKLSMMLAGTLRDAAGKQYTFSTALVVYP